MLLIENYLIQKIINHVLKLKWKSEFISQSNLINSLAFQSSYDPSGKYLLIVKGITLSINSFSAIRIGS